VLLMPVLGGLLVGLAGALLRRWRQREVVDAIERTRCSAGGCRSATAWVWSW
jgi:hypothetical protein